MKLLPNTLGILTVLSSALAQQNLTRANIYAIDIAPEKQLLIANFEVELGFPLGKQHGTAKLDCANQGQPEVNAWKEVSLDQFEKFPDGSKGILDSKAVQVNGSTIFLKGLQGDLKFTCKNQILYTDFGALTANPKGQVAVQGGSFTIEQDSMLRTVRITYPLVSTVRPDGTLMPRGITVNVSSNGGLKGSQKKIQNILLNNVGREEKGAVFLLDEKANTLLPVRYAGNDTGMAKLVNRAVAGRLVFYSTSDYTQTTGWRKLTIDFANALIWTQDGTKPTAIFGK